MPTGLTDRYNWGKEVKKQYMTNDVKGCNVDILFADSGTVTNT